MSYQLAEFSTVKLHELECEDCANFRHPTLIHMPSLTSQLLILRRKKLVTENKIRSVSLAIADVERRVRMASRSGREDIKQALLQGLMVKAGYLHMLIRYSLVLKQDTGKLHYMVAQASRCNPIDPITWREQREVEMVHGAPDIATMALYDFYPQPQQQNNTEDNLFEEQEEEGASDDYSIISHIFAPITSS